MAYTGMAYIVMACRSLKLVMVYKVMTKKKAGMSAGGARLLWLPI